MSTERSRQQLKSMGITFDPNSRLHADLADSLDRTGHLDVSVRNIGLLWAYQAELQRQIEAAARARVEYDRVLGAGVIRYRTQGEKSAEVARMRAEADDLGVYEAALAYRVAEQMVSVCKRAMDILFAELEGWRTKQANERAADRFQAVVS